MKIDMQIYVNPTIDRSECSKITNLNDFFSLKVIKSTVPRDCKTFALTNVR